MREPRHRFWLARPLKSNTRSNSVQRTFLRILQVNYDNGENLSLNFTLTVFWINLLAPYVRILDHNCRRARDCTTTSREGTYKECGDLGSMKGHFIFLQGWGRGDNSNSIVWATFCTKCIFFVGNFYFST